MKPGPSGFTLIEIMIAVVIIGLLAAIATQTFNAVRQASTAAVLANDFRKYADSFETYALEMGTWPEDVDRGIVPPGMKGSLVNFDIPSVVKGNWDWDYQNAGVTAGLSLVDSNADDELMQRVDEKLDDGNLESGRFIAVGGERYTLVLEP